MSGTNEKTIVDPATGGMKGQKDERFDLIPWDALEQVALVYGAGAKKYEDDNWLRGYRWRLSLGALLRHVARFAIGEDLDQETGLPHLAHAAWHCLTLLTFAKRGLGTDDRAKVANSRSSTAALLEIETWNEDGCCAVCQDDGGHGQVWSEELGRNVDCPVGRLRLALEREAKVERKA